jgi:hypothetical protein
MCRRHGIQVIELGKNGNNMNTVDIGFDDAEGEMNKWDCLIYFLEIWD